MEKYINTVIVGSGSYMAGRVIKNDYFLNAEFYDTNNERILRSNEEIIEVLEDGMTMSATCSELVLRANLNGGHDNVTVVCLKVMEEDING